MTEDVLDTLIDHMRGDLPALERVETGFRALRESRYARLTLCFDYDTTAESIRIYTRVPPPAGAGADFLTWCLSTNTLYWDVKIGLDAQGMLLIHADVDLDHGDLAVTARVMHERMEAICELLDDDLVPYQLGKGLCTPAQTQRWSNWDS